MSDVYSARISFNVVYHAKEAESLTHERAESLARTMLAVLRGSPKVKVIEIDCAGIDGVEAG